MKYLKFYKQNLLYVVLCVLLPVLAIYQYNQIGELSVREKESLKNNIETSSFQYSFVISKELYDIQSAFFTRDSTIHASYVYEYAKEKLKQFRNGQNGDKIDGVLLATANSGVIEVLKLDEKLGKFNLFTNADSNFFKETKLTNYLLDDDDRFPNMLFGDFKYLVVPIKDMSDQKHCIILKLNKSKFIEDVIEKNFKIYFPDYGEYKIIIVIKDNFEKFVYTNDETGREPQNQTYEYSVPFGMIPPLDGPRGGFGKFEKNNGFKNFDKKNFARMLMSEKHHKRPPGFENSLKLYVGFRSGNLEERIQTMKIRNLGISFSILLLLGFVIVLIAINTSKTKKLAEQRLQFMAGISHDLRTPITVIKSAGQNLYDGIVGDKDRAVIYGDMIIKETNKLWEMVETALSFADIQTSPTLMNKQKHNLNEIVEKSITENYLSQHNVTINLSNNIGETIIDCDSKALLSAFRNIINNAVKFSGNNPVIDITLNYSDNQKFIEISFKDNGIGIDKKDLKNIFKPFYRGKSAYDKNVHGNGVGLSIVKNAANLHSGDVRAESKKGRGTTIIFSIPVK